MLKKAAQDHGSIETLGALVHNDQVTEELKENGIRIAKNLDEITGQIVAISAHGVSPQIEADLIGRQLELIDATCPDVKRAQRAARNLAKDGYFVIVFGEAQHPEVKGILGWADGKGLATLDTKSLASLDKMSHKLGILSQTTQIPENYNRFIKEVIDLAWQDNIEIRIINTICRSVGNRQTESVALSRKVDLMLVIGGRTSANTRRLFDLCSLEKETHMIEKAEDINLEWLKGKNSIGITSGTSTSEKNIKEVIEYLENSKE
jgi:4-hydroxy-3-methylbut-2-en-1-yl diphosphate reductase